MCMFIRMFCKLCSSVCFDLIPDGRMFTLAHEHLLFAPRNVSCVFLYGDLYKVLLFVFYRQFFMLFHLGL